MMWVFAIIIVLVLGGIAAVAAGLGSPMPDVHVDRRDALVPADGPLRAADLRKVRFSVTVRGYRMSEVDALLARLAEEAEQRQASTPAPSSEPDDAEPENTSKGDAPADTDIGDDTAAETADETAAETADDTTDDTAEEGGADADRQPAPDTPPATGSKE